MLAGNDVLQQQLGTVKALELKMMDLHQWFHEQDTMQCRWAWEVD
jgi:hypothetical protein